MSTSADSKIKLTSQPYLKRVALIPTILISGLSWVFVVLWLGVCLWIVAYNPVWAAFIAISDLLFAAYLTVMTVRLLNDGTAEYTLELTDDEAVLTVVDRRKRAASTKMILLNDVTYAEYYPYLDSSSIVFHAPYSDLEVPLWPMGRHGQDVVDFLKGRGIRVVNVQFDDSVPG